MTTEEIEKAVNEFAEKHGFRVPYDGSNEFYDKVDVRASKDGFKAGVEFADNHWQEKTRWKSLEKEPPSELQYDKMYLLRTESGSPYLSPLPYKESIKEFISYGFIEWKEIE